MEDNKDIEYKCPVNMKRPFHHKNPYQLYNIKLLVASVNKDVEVLGVDNRKEDYVRCYVRLKCTCGNEFEIEKYLIGRKKRELRCNSCFLESNKAHCLNRTIKKQQERIDFLTSMGYEVLTNKQSFRNRDKILLKNKDGYIGYSTYSEIKKGCDILPFSAVYNKDYFIYNINHLCEMKNYSVKVIGYADAQKWTRVGIKCLCECGAEYETSIDGLIKGEKTRCDSCTSKMSRFCYKVEKYFEEKGIKFTKEVRYRDCKDKSTLPFDYEVETGLIEVDGKQHEDYKSYHFCKTMEENVERFILQKYHDSIKDEYCKSHNIKLLRISYRDVIDGSFKDKINNFMGI